jgi:hypothetical protein
VSFEQKSQKIKRIWNKKRKKSKNKTNARERLSVEQPSRYKIFIRPKGTQISHSIRRFIPSKLQRKETVSPQTSIKLEVHKPEIKIHRDHHDAIDFFHKCTGFIHRRESISNLRERICSGIESIEVRKEVEKKIDFNNSQRRLSHYMYFQSIDKSLCPHQEQNNFKTDWSILVQPACEKRKLFTTSRLEWLIQLEHESKVNKEILLKENFNKDGEICCFPFNTFKLFSKNEIQMADFYIKN